MKLPHTRNFLFSCHYIVYLLRLQDGFLFLRLFYLHGLPVRVRAKYFLSIHGTICTHGVVVSLAGLQAGVGVRSRASLSDLSHIMPFSVLGSLVVDTVTASSIYLIPVQGYFLTSRSRLCDHRFLRNRFSGLSLGVRSEYFRPVYVAVRTYIVSIVLSGSHSCMYIRSISSLGCIFPS